MGSVRPPYIPMIDFEKFRASLSERRIYEGTAGIGELLELEAAEMEGTVRVLSDDGAVERYEATHLVQRAAETEDFQKIVAALNPPATLPEDFVRFWRLWRRAVLIFRQDYWLLTAREMVSVAKEKASYSPESSGYRGVHRVIPFAEIGKDTFDFAALRLQPGEESWRVCFCGRDYGTAEVETGEYFETDRNFSEWLDRLMESDGWPPTKGSARTPNVIRIASIGAPPQFAKWLSANFVEDSATKELGRMRLAELVKEMDEEDPNWGKVDNTHPAQEFAFEIVGTPSVKEIGNLSAAEAEARVRAVDDSGNAVTSVPLGETTTRVFLDFCPHSMELLSDTPAVPVGRFLWEIAHRIVHEMYPKANKFGFHVGREAVIEQRFYRFYYRAGADWWEMVFD